MSDIDHIERGLAQTFERYRGRILQMHPRPGLLTMPNLTDEDWEPFKTAVATSDIYRKVQGHWIWARGHQNTISVDWIADWAFPQFHFDEPALPIASRILKTLSASTASIRHCTAMWGIEVAQPTQIDDEVFAFPLKDFEDKYQVTVNDRPKSASFAGFNRSAIAGAPNTIIVATFAKFPFVCDTPATQVGIANTLAQSAERICLALVAIGSLRPVVDISWFEYDDDDLNRVFNEGRRFWRTPEVVPTVIDLTNIDVNRISLFISNLRTTSIKRRSKFLSAIRRFELSLSRHHLGNQAIDLCTAFEQVLGSDGQSPISWTNGLRCAVLIAEDDNEKCRIRDVINSLYKARNQFVHGGDLIQDIATRTMGSVTLCEILVEARQVFGRLIERLVSLGNEPDWFDLETTGRLRS